MPAQIPPQRAQLGRRLRQLRAAAFSSGSAFARHLAERYPDSSWRQTRVSKIERGEIRPSEEDILQWLAATDADEDSAAGVYSLLSASRIEYATFGATYARSDAPSEQQQHYSAIEYTTTTIRTYQPSMVPGLLQTTQYARELLNVPTGPANWVGAESIDLMVAARVARQAVLYQPGKHLSFLLGEAALHTHFGTTGALAGQLDRLTQLAELDTVELGVIPFTAALPAFPLSGFNVYDTHVHIETLTGEQTLDDPADMAVYTDAFEQLHRAAVIGSDATALIRRALAELS